MLTPRAKTLLKFFATLGVSLAFVYLFLRDLSLDEVLDALFAADYLLVPPALLLFALSLVLRARRWGVFYEPVNPGFRMLFPALLVTYAGNNLLPLRAGELIRAQLLRDRAGVSRLRTLGTAAVERLFDISTLGIFLLSGLIASDAALPYVGIAGALLAGAAVGFVIAYLIATSPDLPERLASRDWPFLSRALLQRVANYVTAFVEGFGCLTVPARFLQALALTVAIWALEFGMYWLLAEAFSLGKGFMAIAFAGAAANLALSIPSAQGGVGPFQWAAKEALVDFGVAAAPAAAYALVLHVLLVVPVSIAGLGVFWAMVPGNRGLSFSGAELPAAENQVEKPTV